MRKNRGKNFVFLPGFKNKAQTKTIDYQNVNDIFFSFKNLKFLYNLPIDVDVFIPIFCVNN